MHSKTYCKAIPTRTARRLCETLVQKDLRPTFRDKLSRAPKHPHQIERTDARLDSSPKPLVSLMSPRTDCPHGPHRLPYDVTLLDAPDTSSSDGLKTFHCASRSTGHAMIHHEFAAFRRPTMRRRHFGWMLHLSGWRDHVLFASLRVPVLQPVLLRLPGPESGHGGHGAVLSRPS